MYKCLNSIQFNWNKLLMLIICTDQTNSSELLEQATCLLSVYLFIYLFVFNASHPGIVRTNNCQPIQSNILHRLYIEYNLYNLYIIGIHI